MAFGRLLGVATLSAAMGISQAHAWGPSGHMLVAAVAWEKMDQSTRDRAGELLKLNPMYSRLTSDAPSGQEAEYAFILASIWPDVIKYDDGYTEKDDRINEPTATQNIGYADHLRHRYWHYKDLPFSTDGTPTEQPPEPNAETQILVFRKALGSSSSSDDVKSYDMVWLLHLVGDVHQPLHATSRFTANDHTNNGPGDSGGTEVKVCAERSCPRGRGTITLHVFWDGIPDSGTWTSMRDIITAAESLADASDAEARVSSPRLWLEESEQIAEQSVYAGPIKDGLGIYKITQAYRENAKEIADKRIALAGARLARLLDDALR